MADPKTLQKIDIDGLKLEVQKCWEQLGISKNYMLALLGRDEYTPVLDAMPLSKTLYYTDPASGNKALFHPGQFVVWPDEKAMFGHLGFGIVVSVDTRANGEPFCVWWLYLEQMLRDIVTLKSTLKTELADLTNKFQDYVTTNTEQTLTGTKTFTNQVRIGSNIAFCHADTTSGVYMVGNANGGIALNAHRDWIFTATLASLSETGRFTAKQLKSEAAQGTAPIEVTSSTRCANLNADLLDGLHSGAFARGDADAATDLDKVNGVGVMSNPANANASSERHYPIDEAGMLVYGNAAYNSACQIYGSYISNRWFARGGGAADGKTEWKEFVFTDTIARLEEEIQNLSARLTNLTDTVNRWHPTFVGPVTPGGDFEVETQP